MHLHPKPAPERQAEDTCMNTIRLSLIVARARNGVIGANGGLPWRLAGDLAFFKRTTLGSPVLMGRNTWESLPRRPLPERANIVLTRQWDYSARDARVYSSFLTAVNAGKSLAKAAGKTDCFVIGGVRLYERALPMVDRIYLTEVDAAPEGDVYFPDFDEAEWREIACEHHGADAKNDYAFTIRTLERVR